MISVNVSFSASVISVSETGAMVVGNKILHTHMYPLITLVSSCYTLDLMGVSVLTHVFVNVMIVLLI